MSNYTRGRALEHRIKKKFLEKGFFVIRAAQSKGLADLVCVRHDMVIFIQCKLGGVIGPEEWNLFYDQCLRVEAEPVIALSKERKTRILKILEHKKPGEKKRLEEITCEFTF